jgi:hypothetical protein
MRNKNTVVILAIYCLILLSRMENEQASTTASEEISKPKVTLHELDYYWDKKKFEKFLNSLSIKFFKSKKVARTYVVSLLHFTRFVLIRMSKREL